MIVDFYRCDSCKRVDEIKLLISKHGCVCGSKRVRPTRLTKWGIFMFVLKHPSYLIKALFGAE